MSNHCFYSFSLKLKKEYMSPLFKFAETTIFHQLYYKRSFLFILHLEPFERNLIWVYQDLCNVPFFSKKNFKKPNGNDGIKIKEGYKVLNHWLLV
jgi:hypothetical protein